MRQSMENNSIGCFIILRSNSYTGVKLLEYWGSSIKLIVKKYYNNDNPSKIKNDE